MFWTLLGASRRGNARTPWWTPVVREAVRLKKEASWVMISGGTPQAVAMYRRVWEEFGEATEKDLWTKVLLEDHLAPQEGEAGNHQDWTSENKISD